MQDTRSRSSRPFTLCREMRISIVLAFAMLLFAAWRFPESMAHGALFSPVGAAVALFGYCAASQWACRTSSDAVRIALASGAKVGVLLGTVAAINHSVETFSDFRAPVPAILGVSMWGLMFFSFGGVSSATCQKVGSIGLGIVASVWSALVSAVSTVLFASAVGLVYMQRMQLVLAGDFLASGMVDSRAFVVRNLFDGAFTHLLLAPCLAAIIGAASGLAFGMLRSLGRRTVVALGSLGVLLFLSGVAAIRFASSLDRAARPPFIMFGLLAMCISLASAYSLATAIRRRPDSLQPSMGASR